MFTVTVNMFVAFLLYFWLSFILVPVALLFAMTLMVLSLINVLMSMPEYKYFKPGEFELCTPRCSLKSMDPAFMLRLDNAREIAGVPFVINSAYRSVDYEIQHGRPGTSSHTKGVAVDISCITPGHRYLIITALLKVGFRRFGIYPSFIHVDGDLDKPDSIWHCPKNQM